MPKAATTRKRQDDESVADLGPRELSSFKLWSSLALKDFLFLRGKSVEGSFDELAARAFIAWEESIPVKPSLEESMRSNLSEYKEKLRYGDVTLPDPFTLKDDWLDETACSRWPSLYFTDISEYLKLKTPAELYQRLANEYKQGKAFRYFTSGAVKEINFHLVSSSSLLCFLACKVSPSMKSGMLYKVWVAMEKDEEHRPGGRIHSAYCTCTAGLHGACNHIAGLLYRVEYAVRAGLTKPSCTSQKCVWNTPSFTATNPVVLAEQQWHKDKYFKEDDEGYHQSVRCLALDFSPLSATQESRPSSSIRKDLMNILRGEVPDSCVLQLNDARPFVKPPAIVCPPPPQQVARLLLTKQDSCTVADLVKAMQLESSERDQLCTTTVQQANCKDWLEQRNGRLTASNFSRIYTKVETLKKTPQANISSLVNHVMGATPVPTTAAMKHGSNMEEHAKIAYKRLRRKNHRVFIVTDVGLCIHPDFPYIGATPDLLVNCKCCGEGLCEIKCPYNIRDDRPTPENWPHFEKGSTEQNASLSKKSSYYYQIQGQMAITQRHYCDLFVYTAHGHYIQRILFDPVFCLDMLENLRFFWLTHVAPVLLNPGTGSDANSDDTEQNVHTPKDCARTSLAHTSLLAHSKGPLGVNTQLPPVFLCGVCQQDLVEQPSNFEEESVQCDDCLTWYHFICMNISSEGKPDSSAAWFCSSCEKL